MGLKHQAGQWQGWPALESLGNQSLGNPTMQQVSAVTHLPAEVGQGRGQGCSSTSSGGWGHHVQEDVPKTI